jgi:hypothetical protein
LTVGSLFVWQFSSCEEALSTEKILVASHFHCFSYYHITFVFAVVAVPVVRQAKLQRRARQSR